MLFKTRNMAQTLFFLFKLKYSFYLKYNSQQCQVIEKLVITLQTSILSFVTLSLRGTGFPKHVSRDSPSPYFEIYEQPHGFHFVETYSRATCKSTRPENSRNVFKLLTERQPKRCPGLL